MLPKWSNWHWELRLVRSVFFMTLPHLHWKTGKHNRCAHELKTNAWGKKLNGECHSIWHSKYFSLLLGGCPCHKIMKKVNDTPFYVSKYFAPRNIFLLFLDWILFCVIGRANEETYFKNKILLNRSKCDSSW